MRPARAADAERLRELTVASKGSWGYPPDRMREWGASLDFEAALREQGLAVVAESAGRVVAWTQVLAPVGGVSVLDHLWVDPGWMRAGIGSRLFRRAADAARAMGAVTMEWEGEPHAVGFYERMGGTQVRTQLSEWGRELPVLALDLR